MCLLSLLRWWINKSIQYAWSLQAGVNGAGTPMIRTFFKFHILCIYYILYLDVPLAELVYLFHIISWNTCCQACGIGMEFEIGNLFPGGDLGHVDLVLHLILVQAQWRREAVPNLMIVIVIKVTQIEFGISSCLDHGYCCCCCCSWGNWTNPTTLKLPRPWMF